MAPFLSEEILKLMKEVMEKFIKTEHLSGSVSSLIAVDVHDTNNHLANKKINIGFGATTSLATADVGIAKEAEFRQQCLDCYKSIRSKLKERSPIKYDFVLSLRSFNPQYIIRHPNSTITNFENLLSCLINNKFYNPTECETLLKQYKKFVAYVRLDHKERFNEFDINSEDRLDVLYRDIIGEKADYSNL